MEASAAARVGAFERVSFQRFAQDMEDTLGDLAGGKGYLRHLWGNISLPVRATSGSAGYDFASPFSFVLKPGESIKIPTGVRAWIEEGWWLCCLPRSGLGFKYRLQLDNTAGVIDGDYYFSENEGHIFAKLTNDSREGKVLDIHAGDRFMQGIFLPYGLTYYDNAQSVRSGGMGSTGK